jgi:hypothetical protein
MALHYNVYSNDVFWDREDFPDYFKVVFTCSLSVIFGLFVAAIVDLIFRH